MSYSPIAKELNESLKKNASPLFESLSETGKRIFFPKGILSQGAEAKEKANVHDASLGVARENGKPMIFPHIRSFFSKLEDDDIFSYVSSEGRKKLRQLWHQEIFEKNPSLKGKEISLPIVTNGITHGISLAADLFCDPEDVIVIPDLMWGNYRLMFHTINHGRIENFALFDENFQGFNIDEFRKAMERAGETRNKILVLLNFPNNPTGYTPTPEEIQKIQGILVEMANRGKRIVLICDDAYFGLNFGEGSPESLFAFSAGAHENLINIKLDGATKEDYVWGFRVGFISFSIESENQAEVYRVLENKIKGLIRARISNLNNAAQSILEKCLGTPEIREEAQINYKLMRARAERTHQILQDKKFEKFFVPYPFNSGYFMCIRLHQIDAEKLRIHLLDNYGIGTISIDSRSLRIGFCAINKEHLEKFFDQLYAACTDLSS